MQWIPYFISKRKTGLINDKKGSVWWNQLAGRMIQIQLCVMYAFSGLHKLQGKTWWEGTALWEAVSFYDMAILDFSFLLKMPALTAALTWGVLLFEIYFPVAVWFTKIRGKILWLGVMIHTFIAICMGLYFFSLIWLSAYILFIPPQTLKNWIARLQK